VILFVIEKFATVDIRVSSEMAISHVSFTALAKRKCSRMWLEPVSAKIRVLTTFFFLGIRFI